MRPTPHIVCTVTNDLSYDQRMHRICSSLSEAGYQVTLVGRQLPASVDLPPLPFQTIRLRCIWHKGFLFYAEFNLRLLIFLLKISFDAACAIDLDTLAPVTVATLLRRKRRVFDAHEYFTEVPELQKRPFVRVFWGLVARCCLPFYRHAYTVGPALALIFEQKYSLPFAVVRNVPLRTSLQEKPAATPPFILYQGALNEGRGIEAMLEAMPYIPAPLVLYLAGEGDLSDSLRQQAQTLGPHAARVHFLGYMQPAALRDFTRQAWLGINLLENKGLSYYYSLANKFFDYVQAEVPVLTMQFPEYQALVARYEVGCLIAAAKPGLIAAAIAELWASPEQYQHLVDNCRIAAQEWHWEHDKAALLACWKSVFEG